MNLHDHDLVDEFQYPALKMNIKMISLKGSNPWNEDAIVINQRAQIYGVLDGATSRVPFRGPNDETGGYLASRIVKQYLESISKEDVESIALSHIVLKANDELREKMLQNNIDMKNKQELWTAGIAVVRVSDHYIDYVHAGDCMIIAQYNNGDLRAITYDQVANIGSQNKKILQDAVKRGVSTRRELEDIVVPKILAGKDKINTAEGYGVLSGELELVNHLEYGRFNRIQLNSLFIVSDGLFLPDEHHNDQQSNMQTLARTIKKMSLHGYAKWLLDLERADEECIKYPRVKVSDDKTGIVINFE